MNSIFHSLILLSLWATNVWAKSSTISIYGKKYSLIEKDGLTYSRACLQGKKLKCQAYQMSLKIKLSQVPSRFFQNGVEPGSALCKYAEGEVVAEDGKGFSKRYFCRYPDMSLIETSSLYLQAERNSKKK